MFSKIKKINLKIAIYKLFICFFYLIGAVSVTISLYTYNDFDPSFFTVNNEPPLNALGLFGSNLSSLLFVILGDASWLIPICMIFLLRVVILSKYSFSSFIIRFLGVIFCILIISISLTSIGMNSGFFGKTIIVKFRALEADINQYEKIILYISLFIFSIALLILTSMTKLGFFIISYKLFKKLLGVIKKIYLLFFHRKRLFQNRVRNIKKESASNRKA